MDTDGKLYILSVDEADSKSVYKCETRHKLSGKTAVTSQLASGRVHVTRTSSSIPPSIVHSKQEVKAYAGQLVVLPCVAHAYPPPTYRFTSYGSISH